MSPPRFSRLLGLNTWLQKNCNISLTTSIFQRLRSKSEATVLTGWTPPKQTWFESAKGQYLLLPQWSFCSVCQYTQPEWHTHTPGHSMNDHRTSLQDLNGHAVDISHKDNNNTVQLQQLLLMDKISAEPCPQSSPQTDCNISELLQDSAPKSDFLENSQGNQDSILQHPITPEQQPLSPDTLSLSPASPLLCVSEKMDQLVYTGTKLFHSFAANPQMSTKKHPTTTTKACGPSPSSSSPSSCESSSASAASPGLTPSSICSRWTKNNWFQLSVICVGSPLW